MMSLIEYYRLEIVKRRKNHYYSTRSKQKMIEKGFGILKSGMFYNFEKGFSFSKKLKRRLPTTLITTITNESKSN